MQNLTVTGVERRESMNLPSILGTFFHSSFCAALSYFFLTWKGFFRKSSYRAQWYHGVKFGQMTISALANVIVLLSCHWMWRRTFFFMWHWTRWLHCLPGLHVKFVTSVLLLFHVNHRWAQLWILIIMVKYHIPESFCYLSHLYQVAAIKRLCCIVQSHRECFIQTIA